MRLRALVGLVHCLGTVINVIKVISNVSKSSGIAKVVLKHRILYVYSSSTVNFY